MDSSLANFFLVFSPLLLCSLVSAYLGMKYQQAFYKSTKKDNLKSTKILQNPFKSLLFSPMRIYSLWKDSRSNELNSDLKSAAEKFIIISVISDLVFIFTIIYWIFWSL